MFKQSISNFIKAHAYIILLVLLIIFYLFNGIQYLRWQSVTSDEGAFYNYAKRYLKGSPNRIYPESDNSKMPVVVLNTIPRVAEQLLNPGLKRSDWGLTDIMRGRYITLFISIFTILIVYAWTVQLYGNKAGLFAAFLMAFCPNNLSNAALITTDSYSVLLLLTTMYFLWKFCKTGNKKYFILFSLSAAISQLIKQSLFHLYVLVLVCLFIYYLVNKPAIRFGVLIKYLLVFALINWLIINAGYYFHESNLTLGNYHFMSNLFQNVQRIFPGWLLLPFPRPFIEGLDMTKYYDQLGGGFDGLSSFGKVTILGKSATGGSFWYYYFVSIFFKTPISYLILFAASLIALMRHGSLKKFIQNELFLLIPVLYFLVVFSFFYKTQCGIRHIIFIYPFLFIATGGLIPLLKNIFSKTAVTVLSIFLVVSVLRYWKNYYPYTNEFIPDKKMAYNYVGAGNLEFLQGSFFLRDYLKKHPDVKPVTEEPQTGTFIINTEDYLDIWNRHSYDWISHIKPSGQVAYNWLLITVEENDLRKK